MATKKHTTTARPIRAFTPVDLGNGKVYIPVRNEFGKMEYAMVLDGERIGFATSPEAATTTLNDVAYERAQQLAADLADEQAERDAAAVISEPKLAVQRRGGAAYVVTTSTYHQYRLHNEWPERGPGIDTLANAADCAPRWYGTEFDTLSESPATIAALRALWHRLFDPQPIPDTCEVCTEAPATVTVRSRGGVVRVCRPCFDAGWDQNEHAGGSWEADIDECALTLAEAHRAAVMRQRDILSVDLADLRKAVDESVTVGVLAALVISGCYLHSRQLLISDPAAPDWATTTALAAFVGEAA